MNLQRTSLIAFLLILVASLSIQTVGADEAQFDLKADVKTTGRLLTEMAWNTETPYPYGNWYGPGWWGGGNASDNPGTRAPVDELDSIAMRHDFAYQIAEEQGKLHGPAEEQRLKALADAIAVQDSKKLPADPRDWDPPAPDPAKADRYRRRIGFGFSYLSTGRTIGAVAGKTYTAIKDMVNGSKPTGTSSDLSQDDIDRMARERSQQWFETTKITETYRIKLTAPVSLISEGETVPLTLTLLPVSSTATAEGAEALGLFAEVSLDADGPCFLSQYLIGTTSTVNLTAKDPWFGSNVGKTVNVTGTSKVIHFAPTPPGEESGGGLSDQDVAEGQEYLRSVQILEGSIDLQVAIKTVLSLTASPDKISEWPKDVNDPCREIHLRAKLTTEKGKALTPMIVTFTLPDGSELDDVTDSLGEASVTVSVCESMLAGEASHNFTYRASTLKTTMTDGVIYFPSSNSVSVRVEGRGTRMVRGRVVDSVHDDRAIAGASLTVELLGETQTVTSGSDGTFIAEFDLQEEAGVTASAILSAIAKGFDPLTTSASAGSSATIRMDPVAAVITCIVLDAESGERLDGSIIRMLQPLTTTVEANNGQATIHGIYVGDTVAISAGGFNHKTYQKTGVVTAPDVTITFNLPVGEGEMAGGDLDPTEVDPEDLPILHSLTIWATPANPGPGQNVNVTGQIFPPEPGIPIKLEIVGTDGYSSSVMSMTNAMGQAYLPIPGGGMGVVDRVTVLIIGENVRKRLNYSF